MSLLTTVNTEYYKRVTHDWVEDDIADIFRHFPASFNKVIGHVVDSSSETRLLIEDQSFGIDIKHGDVVMYIMYNIIGTIPT